MSRPRLEKRPQGHALVTDSRPEPFGYVRSGKLKMWVRGNAIEFEPEDLERLAKEIRAARAVRTWRVPATAHD